MRAILRPSAMKAVMPLEMSPDLCRQMPFRSASQMTAQACRDQIEPFTPDVERPGE